MGEETTAPAAKERPGWQTTEFWLALACLAAGVVLILRGHADYGSALIGTATAGYGIARGITKR